MFDARMVSKDGGFAARLSCEEDLCVTKFTCDFACVYSKNG